MKKEDIANIMGWGVIALGTISSLISGNTFKILKYNWAIAISGIIGSVILGSIFLFISEILNTGDVNYENISIIHRDIKEIKDKLQE